uniref:Peptidase_S9 domain-containing protein n=1 Tax=Strongyloides papillosus TaxID=174720 RepID=A0A0N5C712_STREA
MSTFYQEYERRAASHNFGGEPLGGFTFPLSVPLSKASRLLTQRNISVSQKLPQLEPFVLGLSTPLINNTRKDIGKSLEAKKSFIKNSFHTSSTDFGAYERRNVICGTNKFGSSDIYLYSVNELGEQKSLYEYILEYDEADCDVEIPECCLKKRYKVTTKSINKKHESEHRIVETLMHYNENYEDKLWLRTKKTLDLLDCDNEEVNTVYQGYIKTFKQIPYMENEICFIDDLDFAWYGDAETSNYSRVKIKDPLTDVATTDCPRVLYASNDECVFEFDYREFTTAQYNPVIQQKSLMNDWPQTLYEEVNTTTQPLFKIKYLISPMEQTNTLIVVTNRFYIVFDNRYISRPILRLPHCIYDGGDYVIFTERGLDFKSNGDGKLEGKLYLSYQLSKDVEPGISYNCLFYNEKEDVFSSTVLTSYLANFEDVALYFENKRPEDLMEYGDKIDALTDGVYTRSVCHVSLNNNSEEAFVFRSNSDGSIWYDEIAFNAHNLSDDEINVASINSCQHFWNSQSCSLIKEYVDNKDYEKTRADRFMWDQCFPMIEVDNLIKHTPVDFSTYNENEVNEIVVGFSKKIKEKVDLSDVISTAKEMPEDHELSNIVLGKVKFVEEIIESVIT